MQVLVNILLVINVFVCVALVAVVLLQRSEGGALGMGGGGAGAFMTARGAGDLLTRITWILAWTFFVLALAQTVLSGKLHGASGSLIDHLNVNSLDLSTPQQNGKGAAVPASGPAAPSSTTPPALQAPAPQAQKPAANAPADPLAVLGAPTVQSKVLPPQPPAPAPAPAPAR